MWLIFCAQTDSIIIQHATDVDDDGDHLWTDQMANLLLLFVQWIYSLRTSETNYLNEAYQFYAAIRGRAYYSRAIKEDRPDLMVKKLRYYARFIVVCLLLKKMKLVRELIIELDKQIQEYTTT